MRPRSGTLLVAVLAVVAAAAVAASSCAGSNEQRRRAADASDDRATAMTQAQALASQKRYDQAIDEFVRAAGDDSASTDAVDGAVSSLEAKMRSERLPERLAAVAVLRKRLPARPADEPLRRLTEGFLVDPVVEQVRQAEALLKDRRAFVERMREDGEADVLPTPADRRALTEAEVVDAQARLEELGMSRDVARLYDYERDLAAAMDRFLADDQRYLAEEEMGESALDELAESSDVLGEALWPVQRQLDRVRPGWRPQE